MANLCPHCGSPTGLAGVIEAQGFGRVSKGALLLLAKFPGQFVPTEQVRAAAYAHDQDGGPERFNSLIVLMTRARPRLRAIGVALVGRQGPGGGYKLEWIKAAAEAA